VTKKELAWLLTRVAGLWLLWSAVHGIVVLVGALLNLEDPELAPRAVGLVWPMVLQTIAYLMVGLYCTFGGTLVVGILDNEHFISDEQPKSILS
jgi:hypothetical protein